MKTAAAYIRVSTDDQEEYSPESQLKLIRDYVKKNGYVLPDEYIFQDDGISASSVRRRTAFNDMIALAKSEQKPFDAILVWKFSRFARNREESVLYKGILRKKSISVISISEPIIDGPFGTLIESIIEWFDEYYLINLSAEVKRGMTEKFSRGEAMGTAPFGYKIDSKSKTFIIDEKKAEAVKDIFNSYLIGEGMRQIAKRLSDAGFKTNRGNVLDNRFIDYVLHNPVYIGKIRWSVDGKIASKRDYDNPKLQTVDGKHLPIIDMELWNSVQDKLAKQKAHYKKYRRTSESSEWMLKGLVRCSSCGATLVRIHTATPSMQCHNYARGSCKLSHSLSIAKANKLVILELRRRIENKNFNIIPAEPNVKTDVPDLTQQIKQQEKMLKRCKEAYKNGIDTLEEYSRNKAEITEEIERLKKENEKNRTATEFSPERYAQKVKSVLEIIERSDVTEQNKSEALRSIISHIVYEKAKGNLQIYFYS